LVDRVPQGEPSVGDGTLARICGHPRAFELLVLGAEVDTEWMLRAGLVNDSVPARDVEEVAIAAALRLAAQPREAMLLARRMLRPDPAAIIACIEAEIAHFRTRLQSPEAMAAFAAFLDRKDG